jgi:hypothetical protein
VGILRVTSTALCVALAVVGYIAITVGVALVWSLGGACIVAGMLALGASVLLFDPKPGSDA